MGFLPLCWPQSTRKWCIAVFRVEKFQHIERARLQAALELNQPLATAYYMKERLRLLF